MKQYKKALWMAVLCMGIMVFACVTINIYFPAEKVESVAGDIVDDIRGRNPGEQDNQKKEKLNSISRPIKFALMPTIAWAEEATTVSNPTIRALKAGMKTRFAKMKPYYAKGALSEGANGYVSSTGAQGLSMKEKRDLNNLVNAENRDRKTLYQEVARALKIDASQVSRVATIFAKEWQRSVR
ncbi:DUF1318 domain-containing protein [Thermodesulfobacteriota bacterium]